MIKIRHRFINITTKYDPRLVRDQALIQIQKYPLYNFCDSLTGKQVQEPIKQSCFILALLGFLPMAVFAQYIKELPSAQKTTLPHQFIVDEEQPQTSIFLDDDLELLELKTDTLSGLFSNPLPIPNIDWQENDNSQYAIIRSSGDLYFKGSAGYSWTHYYDNYINDLSVVDVIKSFEDEGTLGLGAGYNLNHGNRLEFDYTINNKNGEQLFRIGYTF